MYKYTAGSIPTHLKVVPAQPQLDQLTDTDLVVFAQGGNERAFKLLIKRSESSIRSHLYQLAPDSNERSDFEQEILIRMWRSIRKLRNPASFKAWVRQITTNVFYDSLRKKPAFRITSLDEPMSSDGEETSTRDVQDVSAMPQDLLERAELLVQIEDALAKLPEQTRKAMILREVHGLSYTEIATATQCEKGTVKSRISRARDKVQLAMSPYMKDCA